MGPSYANLFVGYIEKIYFSPATTDQNLIFANVASMTASALLHPADKTQPFYYLSQFLSLAFLDIKLTFVYNNFICREHRKKGIAREELNPHLRQPPKQIRIKQI